MFIKCILGSFLTALATMSFWVTSQYTISSPIQGYLKVSFWIFVSRVVLESIIIGLGFRVFLLTIPLLMILYIIFRKEPEQFSYFRVPGSLPLMHSPYLIEKEKYDVFIEIIALEEWLRGERQRNLVDVQAVLDSVKEDVTDGVYLELCNRFKDLFELN